MNKLHVYVQSSMSAAAEWSIVSLGGPGLRLHLIPSRRGGINLKLNLRSVSVHTHAAFVASDAHSHDTLTESLAKNWVSPLTLAPLWLSSLFLLLDLTGCVWMILTCHSTSSHSQLPLMRPCFSTYSQQHYPPMPRPLLFSLPCPMLVIGSMVFHLPHWVVTFMIRSFALAYTIGLECLYTAPPTPALNVTINTADPLSNCQVGCGRTETGSPGTMSFKMSSL